MPTLREVQLAELQMLKFLDRVCRNNGLKYSLIGGSMLGAIRHKGFIPWDDDIDVYMPLEDVQKLQKLLHSDVFFLQTPLTDIQMPFLMFKLRKNGTRMIETGTEALKMHQGVWLDIFPYCNAGRNAFMKKMQIKTRALLQTYRCRYRYATPGKRRFLHWFMTKMPAVIQLLFDRILMDVIEFFGSEKSSEIFAIDVSNHTIFNKKFFDKQGEYTFEDMSALGVIEYDEYLASIYGKEYMVPKQWNHIGDYSEVEL